MLRRRSTAGRALVVSMVAVLVASACGRSGSSNKATATTAAVGAVGSATTAAAAGVGDFGTLKAVCGPGDAKGATDVRGDRHQHQHGDHG